MDQPQHDPIDYHDLRHQPVKTLYLLYQILSILFVRLPFWAISSIPKSKRPRPTWSVGRCVAVRLINHLVHEVISRAGLPIKFPNHYAIAPGKEINAVWIPPAPHLVIGRLKVWAEEANIFPVSIPGYWSLHRPSAAAAVQHDPSNPPPSLLLDPTARAHPGEKVLLYLHGGGYILFTAHSSSPTAPVLSAVLSTTASVHGANRALAVEYRLSTTDPYDAATPFPAALLDALAGYDYLVRDRGFAPENITVVGDSAGANLAHALTRFLVEHQGVAGGSSGSGDSADAGPTSPTLVPGVPGRLLLLSPWVDISDSHEHAPGSSAQTHVASDYMGLPGSATIQYARRAFLGPAQLLHLLGRGDPRANVYISPASLHPGRESDVSFVGFPQTMVISGAAEVMLDAIRTLVRRMQRDTSEVWCRYHEAPDAPHDFIGFPWFEPQRSDTLKIIAAWCVEEQV